METEKVVCIQCHNACRVAATIDSGRLVAVEPDEDFPGTKSSYSITKGCPRRRIKQKCRMFKGIDARVVHAQHGWWFPEEDGAEPSLYGVWKSNCNVLTDDEPDSCNPISGGWPLRGLLCKIYKVDF